MHRSPYFGQPLEFLQHREYVAGDDLRRIDWKLWSRSDRYYLEAVRRRHQRPRNAGRRWQRINAVRHWGDVKV